MAFLRFVRSNENLYVYVREYKVREYQTDQSITLFRLGRIDKALNFTRVLLSEYEKLSDILISKDVKNKFTKQDWIEWHNQIKSKYENEKVRFYK